jgi:hypothetical protein
LLTKLHHSAGITVAPAFDVKQTHTLVKVLFIREGKFWVAQALEFDLAAQGSSIAKTKRAFEQAFFGQIHFDVKLGRPPLEHLPPAPEKYWREFNRIVKEKQTLPTERMTSDCPASTPPAFMVQAIQSPAHAHR